MLAGSEGAAARTRLPDEIDGSGWDYGTNLTLPEGAGRLLAHRFDWRAAERRLNQFDQFTTNIDGLDIHFIHQRSKQAERDAAARHHGWPGSIVEFTKIIGPLTDPAAHGGHADDAFHVVAISLPGFGFSGKPTERGYSPERMAGMIAKLMARLGYTRYGLQGGDWGSSISRFVALNDASHVAGLHLNFCLAGPPAGATDPNEGVPPAELERIARASDVLRHRARLLPRAEHQAADARLRAGRLAGRPRPRGSSRSSASWSDSDGNVEKKFTKDELLTNITIYWVTQSATSSARIYYENRGRTAAGGACRCRRRARCFRRRSASRRGGGSRRSTT